MASFIRTPDHLTVVFDDGEVATIYNDTDFDRAIEALNRKDWDLIRELANPAEEVKRKIAESVVEADRVKIEGGIVFYDDQPLHMHLTDRMLEMLDEGIDIAPLALFLQNIMENPSYRAVNELYGFLEASDLPITDDGHFLAYKRIRTDWTDDYTGKIDNSIGATPTMPRNTVDEDKNRTCSAGLHFCSRSYLPKYGSAEGGRVIIVKINPADVVAIPTDYNNAKGRCCRYEVINEIELEDESYTSMPKGELEGTFRPVTTDGVDRTLIQYDLDTNKTIAKFATPSEAQKVTGVDSSSISKVARGVRNSAGGYGWRYDAVAATQLAEDIDDAEEDDDFWNDGMYDDNEY